MKKFKNPVDWRKQIRIKEITSGLFEVTFIDPETKVHTRSVIGSSPLVYEIYNHGTYTQDPWYRLACIVCELNSNM